MKIKIEIDGHMDEDEIVIKCKKLTPEINQIEDLILKAENKLVFYKKNQEYYFPSEKVLFFEADEDSVYAHTADDAYRVKFRLYELEGILSRDFVRVSKSCIINIKQILSISRTLPSSNLVEFKGCHKQVYVSRSYFKNLKHQLGV